MSLKYADGDAEFGSNPSMMEEGVVNVLEPAPQTPLLATSGLDHSVKLWSPTTKHFLSDTDAIKRTRSRITANQLVLHVNFDACHDMSS